MWYTKNMFFYTLQYKESPTLLSFHCHIPSHKYLYKHHIHHGAKASAMIYSIIKTAKANEMNTYQYPAVQGVLYCNKLKKAITYISKRKEYLITYLEDGRCRLSNNLSENSILPITVDRKNLLQSVPFSLTISAISTYFMISNCLCNIDFFFSYIRRLIKWYHLELSPS